MDLPAIVNKTKPSKIEKDEKAAKIWFLKREEVKMPTDK